MAGIKKRQGWRVAFLLCAALGLLFAVAATGNAGQGQACANGSGDARAVCVPGNVTTCAQIGLGGATQTTGDANVGMSSDGTFVDVTILNPAVTGLVVVVKGGPHYNVYGGAGSDYHSPPVGNPPGNIGTISHFLGCYFLGTNGTTPPGNGGGPGDPGTPGQSADPGQPGTRSTPAPAVVGQPRTTG